MKSVFCILLVSALLPLSALTQASQQLVLGVSEGWNSSSATLAFYQKKGKEWVRELGPQQVRLGKAGLAWGRGLHQNPAGVTLKREGDRRSPAGAFYIGGAWGYAPTIHKHPALPYRRVTSRDLWIEDVNNPRYNQHLILDHEPRVAWERKAQMKQGDHAHSLKLFIAHNPPPNAIPGGGSAVFFHIWRRNGGKATFGCTTMPEPFLKALIAKIDPGKRPLYVLLPRAEYMRARSAWQLPAL